MKNRTLFAHHPDYPSILYTGTDNPSLAHRRCSLVDWGVNRMTTRSNFYGNAPPRGSILVRELLDALQWGHRLLLLRSEQIRTFC